MKHKKASITLFLMTLMVCALLMSGCVYSHNYDENGNFTQDFESVVQGLYPFVLSSAQGVSDPVTHLAELHAPYTQAGWQNKKATDDVIDGEWSLKHHGANTGIIYQTIPLRAG